MSCEALSHYHPRLEQETSKRSTFEQQKKYFRFLKQS